MLYNDRIVPMPKPRVEVQTPRQSEAKTDESAEVKRGRKPKEQ